MTLLEILQGITATGATGAFAFTWAAYIKAKPLMMQRQNEADGSLRADLLGQMAKLDARIAAQDVLIQKERDDCNRHIARLEAQIQLFRHARNNADARFQALLMLLKRNPDDVPGTIKLIEEMVAQQERTIAAEKGAMAGATGIAGLWSSNPVEAAAEQAVQATRDTLSEIKAQEGSGK